MSIEESIAATEQALIQTLHSKSEGIDDRTGKGAATEAVVAKELLVPHLSPGLRCSKGAVVEAANPSEQSPAIDRVIYDAAAASPLVYDEAHSIFPIEAVCGLVEITMHLDTTKLREDIERMAPVKAMRLRHFLHPVAGTKTKAVQAPYDSVSPRSFVVGLPADTAWSAATIAESLRTIQMDLGAPTHVHGLYVLGIGFFETVPVESTSESPYRIKAWVGPDRLFRFTTALRQSFDRWTSLPPGGSADIGRYVKGQAEVLAE